MSTRSADRSGAIVMATGLVSMGLAHGRWALVAPFLLATCLVPWARTRLTLQLPRIVYPLLVLPFAAMYALWPLSEQGIHNPNMRFNAALYTTAAAILYALGPGERWRFPLVLAAGGAGFLSAGLVEGVVGYGALATLYAAGASAGMQAGRARGTLRRRDWIVGLAFAVSALLGAGASFALEASFDDLNRMFQRAFLPDAGSMGGGFSGAARLDGISEMRGEGGDAVAVRALGERAPGYLRGRVFHRYVGGRWDMLAKDPAESRISVRRGLVVLPGRPVPPREEAPAWWIANDSRYRAYFFLPLESTAVEAREYEVEAQTGGTLGSLVRNTNEGFHVHVSDEPIRGIPEPGFGPRDLEVPEIPDLVAALDDVLAGLDLPPGADPHEVVARLAAWFESRYEYRIGISFDRGRDPIEQFLTERAHGHCEMFASAGTLLLRRAGIPARYVTGFVCAERNDHLEGLWVARARHAHAWIEYHEPGSGWQVAEFTPPDGRPETSGSSWLSGWWQAIKTRWERWLEEEGFGGIAELAGRVAIGGGAVAGLVFLGLVLVRRRPRGRRGRERVLPEPVETLRDEYLRLESALRRRARDLGRADAETLVEYAARLEATALPEAHETALVARRLAEVRYARFPAGA